MTSSEIPIARMKMKSVILCRQKGAAQQLKLLQIVGCSRMHKENEDVEKDQQHHNKALTANKYKSSHSYRHTALAIVHQTY